MPDASELMEYFGNHPAEYDILAAVYKVKVSRTSESAFKPITEEAMLDEFTNLCNWSGKTPGRMPESIKEEIRWAEEQIKSLNAGKGFVKN